MENLIPYAQGRIYYDADSHLMEFSDWLPRYADPAIRDRIRHLYLGGAGAAADQLIERARLRARDAEATRKLEDNIMSAKGWLALGAFDPAERSRALDLLGVKRQLVFPTFAITQFQGADAELLWGGARALNRAMGDFCARDPRLIAVGWVPWDDPERTLLEAREAVKAGCGAIQVNSMPAGNRSPTHPAYHPFWAFLQDHNIPFMLHAGGGRPLRRAFVNNGQPPTTDWLGGGENIRSKDYMTLHQILEQFLAAMVLDGIFEQFPKSPWGSHRARRPVAARSVEAVGSVPSDIQKDRARAAPAFEGIGLSSPTGKGDALSDGAGGMDHRECGRGDGFVLHRLSAPGGWPRPHRTL
jgi:uncharacterized protein